jgi:hypothetical protein
VFGRAKTQQLPVGGAATDRNLEREGGKGRPTPRRKEAERRNYRPIVGGSRIAANASKAERKAARAAHRAAMSAEREQARQALVTGDERHLPARDRGPARRWARDYVDARFNLGEYFLFIVVVLLALNYVPATRNISGLLLWVTVLAVCYDCWLVRRRVNRMALERFGDKARGAGSYALLRALQLRRFRLPRAQVARGAKVE